MNPISTPSTTRRALRWKRSQTLALRPAVGTELAMVTGKSLGKWPLGEGRLARGRHHRIATRDSEIVAAFSICRGRLDFDSFLSHRSPSAPQVLAAVEACDDGDWALKSGLWIAPFLDHRLRHRLRWRLLRLVGPLGAGLFAARYGLRGYVALVFLRRWPDFAPAVSPAAYVQQVEAGSIDDLVLAAHLRFGARPLAILEGTDPPLAVVRWRRR